MAWRLVAHTTKTSAAGPFACCAEPKPKPSSSHLQEFWAPGVVLVACAMNTCDQGDVDGARWMPIRHAAATFAMGACTGTPWACHSIDATGASRDAHAGRRRAAGAHIELDLHWLGAFGPATAPTPLLPKQHHGHLRLPRATARTRLCSARRTPGGWAILALAVRGPCATRAFSPVVEGRRTRPAREGWARA